MIGVDCTEIVVSSGRLERVRVPLGRVEHLRTREIVMRTHDQVRHIVGVDPGDRRTTADGRDLRGEAEVVDPDFVRSQRQRFPRLLRHRAVLSHREIADGLAGDRRVDRRKHASSLDVRDVANAKEAAEARGLDGHRPRRGSGAGCLLRKCGRERGVERHVPLHLLHDLVDATVEHGHAAEPLEQGQRLFAVVGAPAPLGIDAPERDVREHDDGRARRQVADVALEPLELRGAE